MLASLDQGTERIAQDLASLRRDTERGHGELHQDRRLLQSMVTGQMWILMSVVKETSRSLATLPETCPWTPEQVLTAPLEGPNSPFFEEPS